MLSTRHSSYSSPPNLFQINYHLCPEKLLLMNTRLMQIIQEKTVE